MLLLTSELPTASVFGSDSVPEDGVTAEALLCLLAADEGVIPQVSPLADILGD